MLQGLLIRQAFKVAEWLLVILIGVSILFWGRGFVKKDGFATTNVADARTADTQDSAVAALSSVRGRPEYDGIIKSELFGHAGSKKAGQADAVKPDTSEPTPPTELHLKLNGTAATDVPTDRFASAVILNQDDNTTKLLGVGQEVVEQVTLEEIYQRRVVLFNKKTTPPRREELRVDEDKAPAAATAANPPPARGAHGSVAANLHAPKPAPRAPAPNKVSIKKADLVQDLFMNYNEIVTQIKPEVYKDANGQVAGITASNLESLPLAQKLNVKNGDVLQSVNGEAIDSESKIMELVNKYRNATSVNIGLLRDGKPITMNYSLE